MIKKILLVLFLFFGAYGILFPEKPEKKNYISGTPSNDGWWEYTDKYLLCYDRLTKGHKANGLHDRNRQASIKIKKDVCKWEVIG